MLLIDGHETRDVGLEVEDRLGALLHARLVEGRVVDLNRLEWGREADDRGKGGNACRRARAHGRGRKRQRQASARSFVCSVALC